MKYVYSIKLIKAVGTNTYDTFTLLRTSNFNHYRECRLLLIESLNKADLFKDLDIKQDSMEYKGEQINFETLVVTIKEGK
jgi:hypothetical protein